MQLSPTFCVTKSRFQKAQAFLKSQSKLKLNARVGISFRILTCFFSISLCKQLIRKLLTKDEMRRLGSRAGASDVKTHPFFRTTQWALLRHSKPPILPHQGRTGIDTVNFRNVKESQSVDISAVKVKGVPLDSGLRTPGEDQPDPFEEFNSVTLHHDGEDDSIIMHAPLSSSNSAQSGIGHAMTSNGYHADGGEYLSSSSQHQYPGLIHAK
jgi:serine/threonine protein kinase